jgi:hypothetical protein
MKKSLLKLLVAMLTFFVGVFAAKIYLVKYQFVSVPPIEAVKVEEQRTNELNPAKSNESHRKEVPENENDRFHGWYFLQKNIKTMPEFKMIEIYKTPASLHLSKKTVVSSGIFTGFLEHGYHGYIESLWTKIDDNKVEFKTKKIKGIEYSFKGFFFKNKTSGKYGEEMLRGTLKKYIKGKKIAEISGDFAYSAPF